MQRLIIVVFTSLMMCMPGAWAAERGALFKLSGSGHVMYLFGTIHVGLPEYFPLEPRISAALAEASAVALEIDPLADPAALARAVATHTMRDASTGAAPAGLQPRLDKALRAAYVDPAMVANLKPWLIASVLTINEFALQGGRAELSVDLHLATQAHERKIPVIELESITAQFAMFNSMNPAQQWEFLDDTVSMLESGREKDEVVQIMRAWSRADRTALDAIAAEAEQDTSVSGKFVQKVLLEARNGPMADKLAALLAKQDKVVAAVGVLHLVGKLSVPAQLRARGITVERIY